MPHLHSDLLAVTRRVTEIVGSDRVLDSHEQSEKGRIDILVEEPEAVDAFAEHWDVKVESQRSFIGRLDSTAVATIDGIRVRVSAHGYVSAVSA